MAIIQFYPTIEFLQSEFSNILEVDLIGYLKTQPNLQSSIQKYALLGDALIEVAILDKVTKVAQTASFSMLILSKRSSNEYLAEISKELGLVNYFNHGHKSPGTKKLGTIAEAFIAKTYLDFGFTKTLKLIQSWLIYDLDYYTDEYKPNEDANMRILGNSLLKYAIIKILFDDSKLIGIGSTTLADKIRLNKLNLNRYCIYKSLDSLGINIISTEIVDQIEASRRTTKNIGEIILGILFRENRLNKVFDLIQI